MSRLAVCILMLFALAARLLPGEERPKAEKPVSVEQQEAEALRRAQELAKTDPKAAEAVLDAYLAVRRTPAALFQMAVLKSRQGQQESSLELFREVLKADPSFPGAQKNVGRLLAAAKRYGEAAEALRAGIAAEGPDADCSALLGQCYLILGKPAPAETALRWAQVQRPDDPQIILAIAQALYDQGRFADCEAAARATLALSPREPAAWGLLANARISGSRPAEAIDAIEALLLVSKGVRAEMLWALGDLYLAEGLSGPAAEAFEKAMAADKPSADRLRSMARAFLALRDAVRAAAFAKRLLESKPEDSGALLVLGQCAKEKGDAPAARDAYARALKADPLNGEALLALGDMALDEKRYADALASFRSARAIPAFEDAAGRAEADALLREGRLAEALAVIDQIRAKRPDPQLDALAREVRLRVQEAGKE